MTALAAVRGRNEHRGEAMKGANPTVCDKRLRLVGDKIVNHLPGGWHALLWAGRRNEVNARLHLHRERAGAACETGSSATTPAELQAALEPYARRGLRV